MKFYLNLYHILKELKIIKLNILTKVKSVINSKFKKIKD